MHRLSEIQLVFNLHSQWTESPICLQLSTISRDPSGSYNRHPRKVTSVSQNACSMGQISGSAMSNLRKTPVALGIIHVSWKPVRYNHMLKKGVSVSVFVTVTLWKPESPQTELWLTVAGNTCIRHVSVSAETLKRIPYTRVSIRFTLAETLTVMFPQLVNSEDIQLSVEFPEQWKRKLSLIGLLFAAFMFPQIPLSVDYSLDFLNVLTLLDHPVSNHMFILSGI